MKKVVFYCIIFNRYLFKKGFTMKKSLFKSSLLISLILATLLLFSSCYYLLGGITSDTTTDTSSTEIKYVSGAFINKSGELVLAYSDGSCENIGPVVGKDGEDGKDGIDGKDGQDGKDGKDGATITTDGNSTPLALSIANCIQSSVIIQCGFKKSITSMVSDSYSGGSGIIYSCNTASGDAIIVTNYHVVFNADSLTENGISDDISVFLYGSVSSNQAIEATYIGGSMNYDLAVLKISNSEMIKNSEVKPVRIKDSGEIHVGDDAIAIGNPQGKGFSVTSGIISVDSENVTIPAADDSTEITMRLLRVDTPVNSGNSGGGLFDKDGNLIGIVNAKSVEHNVENVGYAIPSSTVVAVVENILYYCEDTSCESVQRPLLGITVQITNPYSKYNSETGYVDLYESSTIVEVTVTGLAYGKLYAGDIIKEVSISGSTDLTVEITRQYQLLDAFLHARVGDTVILTVERDGQLLDTEFNITTDCITNS